MKKRAPYLIPLALFCALVLVGWNAYKPAAHNVPPTHDSAWAVALPHRAAVASDPGRGAIIRVEVAFEDGTTQIILPGVVVATATPIPTNAPASATPTPTIAPTWTATYTYTPPPTNTPHPSATAHIEPSPTVEVVTPSATITPTLEVFPACSGEVNNASGLNLRSKHDLTGDKIIQLQDGETVEIEHVYVYEQHVNEWAFVKTNTGFAGWLAAYFYGGQQLLAWDELSEMCLPPYVTFEYVNNPLPTKVAKCIGGLHVLMGASQYFLNFLDGVCWVKGLTGSEHLALQAKAIDPSIIIIDRSLLIGGHLRDGPTKVEWDDPAGYYKLVKPGWTPGFDYYEFKNEDDASDPAKETDFNIAMLDLMGKDGYCGLAMSSGPGNPPLEYWYELIRLLRWIDANPCGTWPDGTLKYHGLAWHVTGKMPPWVKRDPLSYIYNLWITERHVFINELLETAFNYSLRDDYEGERFKGVIVVTEMGWQDYVIPNTEFSCEEVRAGWQATIEAYEATQIIDGFTMWNLGGTGQWVDLSGCMPMPVIMLSLADIQTITS
jgi:hypothetical protein